MADTQLTLEQVYWKGLNILKKGLGTENAIRFIWMLRNGSGEVPDGEDQWLDGVDLRTIFDSIKLDEESAQKGSE